MSTPGSPRIYVHGTGAVSPAGWGVELMGAALKAGRSLETTIVQAGAGRMARVHKVPAFGARPAWLAHPRMRRASAISQFAVGAAVEALGAAATAAARGGIRLGILCAVMSGSVAYSRRFFAEVLDQPATASPMLFPETVFNAPSSHVGAVVEAAGPNDTLVADQTGFLTALETATDWLSSGLVEGCLVLSAEEADWITADAQSLFAGRAVLTSEGAAALYLRCEPSSVELSGLTGLVPYRRGRTAAEVGERLRSRLPDACRQGALFEASAARSRVGPRHGLGSPWAGPRANLSAALGEGLAASGGWACVAAANEVASGRAVSAVSAVMGSNLGAAAAVFSWAAQE